MEKSCNFCGGKFVPYHKNHQMFCSARCQSMRRRERMRGRPARKWQRIERPSSKKCEQCEQDFKPRHGGSRFCSHPCRDGWMASSKGPAWKGGRTKDSNGYVLVMAKGHPAASVDGYVREHRLVMEKVLGRYLDSHETVHHINGRPADNRPENLQLRSGRHGKGVVHRCADCGSRNIFQEKL